MQEPSPIMERSPTPRVIGKPVPTAIGAKPPSAVKIRAPFGISDLDRRLPAASIATDIDPRAIGRQRVIETGRLVIVFLRRCGSGILPPIIHRRNDGR